MPGWEKTVPEEDMATVLGMVTEKEWVPSPADLCTDGNVTAAPGAGQDKRPTCCRPAQARQPYISSQHAFLVCSVPVCPALCPRGSRDLASNGPSSNSHLTGQVPLELFIPV